MGNTLSNQLYFVEYNIGIQICKYFKLPINNCTPHASVPNSFYNNVLHMVKCLNITLKELTEGSVNSIYKRIIYNINRHMEGFKSHCIVSKILPSYLQSFNYKLHFHLLPLKTMFSSKSGDLIMTAAVIFVGLDQNLHSIFLDHVKS